VSDADIAVLERQLGYETGAIGWRRVDVSGSGAEVRAKVTQAIGARLGC
jgi:hypothetical protein